MHQLKDLAGSTESCLREGCPALLAGEARLTDTIRLVEQREAAHQIIPGKLA